MKSKIISSLGIDATDENISPTMAQLVQQRIARASVRWLNISATLWSLVILDSQRTATPPTLSQFLDVMSWRAHDKITAEEFSILCGEWMQNAGSVLDQNQNARSPHNAKQRTTHNRPHVLSLNIFRGLLFEKKFSDADIDLFIGLMLNEVNMKLLHAAISYSSQPQKKSNTSAKQQSSVSSALSVVTHRWLQLSEELFFAIDLPGYGHWSFDEAYFFIACLTMGLQSWSHIIQCESDLSVVTMAALTSQFLRDVGVCVTSGTAGSFGRNGQSSSTPSLSASNLRKQSSSNHLSASGRRGGVLHATSQSGALSASNSNSVVPQQFTAAAVQQGYQPGNCYAISLSMFKRFLVQHHIDEEMLHTLLQHVYTVLDRCVALCRSSQVTELLAAMKTLDDRLSTDDDAKHPNDSLVFDGGANWQSGAGPLRLWQEAVLLAAGVSPGANVRSDQSPAVTLSPPVMFLLSDASSALGAIFRAVDFPIVQNRFVSSSSTTLAMSSPLERNASTTNLGAAMVQAEAANDEIRETAAKLTQMFKLWVSGQQLPSAGSLVHQSPSSIDVNVLMKEPVFHLFEQALMQYKRLQQLAAAAFFDTAISLFGETPRMENNNTLSDAMVDPRNERKREETAHLMAVCAALLPEEENMLMELGLYAQTSQHEIAGASFNSSSSGIPIELGSSIAAGGSNGGVLEEKMSMEDLQGASSSSMAVDVSVGAIPAIAENNVSGSSTSSKRPRYFQPTVATLARTQSTVVSESAKAPVPGDNNNIQPTGTNLASSVSKTNKPGSTDVSAQWTTLLDLRPKSQFADQSSINSSSAMPPRRSQSLMVPSSSASPASALPSPPVSYIAAVKPSFVPRTNSSTNGSYDSTVESSGKSNRNVHTNQQGKGAKLSASLSASMAASSNNAASKSPLSQQRETGGALSGKQSSLNIAPESEVNPLVSPSLSTPSFSPKSSSSPQRVSAGEYPEEEEKKILDALVNTSDLQSQLLLLEQLKRLRSPVVAVTASSTATKQPATQQNEHSNQHYASPEGATSFFTTSAMTAMELSTDHDESKPQNRLKNSNLSSAKNNQTQKLQKQASIVAQEENDELLTGNVSSAGEVAHMLRGILRKMSSADSGKLKLQSLEEVLQLGNTLLQQEQSSTANMLPTKSHNSIAGANVVGGSHPSATFSNNSNNNINSVSNNSRSNNITSTNSDNNNTNNKTHVIGKNDNTINNNSNSSSGRPLTASVTSLSSSVSSSVSSSPAAQQPQEQQSQQLSAKPVVLQRSLNNNHNNNSNNNNNNHSGGLRRTAKAPGTIPNTSNKPVRAFGHALDK